MEPTDVDAKYIVDDVEMAEGTNFEWSYHSSPALAQFLPQAIFQDRGTCSHDSIINIMETKLLEKEILKEPLSRKHIRDAHPPQCDLVQIFEWMKNAGVTTESAYGSDGFITDDAPFYRISGYRALDIKEPMAIVSEVMNSGPVLIALCVHNDLLNQKPYEIYRGEGSARTENHYGQEYISTHSVCVIRGGYDVVGEPFYTFLNTWGNTWGDQGIGRTSCNPNVVNAAWALDL